MFDEGEYDPRASDRQVAKSMMLDHLYAEELRHRDRATSFSAYILYAVIAIAITAWGAWTAKPDAQIWPWTPMAIVALVVAIIVLIALRISAGREIKRIERWQRQLADIGLFPHQR